MEEEVDGEDAESEDDDSELSLQVDQDGRVCSPNGLLTNSLTFDPPVRVFDNFVIPERTDSLRQCCEQCFKVKPSKGRYSSGKTFWAEWGRDPRSELEALALAILLRHCPEPAATAGVEWWTLCLDDDAEVGWHWDRDYVLEDSGVNLHPMLSTVTYLSAASSHVSTVTLDVLSPPHRDPKHPVSLPAAGSTVACTVVPPHPGRHLVFDGRYLHGAPERSKISIAGSATGVKRVTFMANIWVGHKPSNASPLPSELQGWSNSNNAGTPRDAMTCVLAVKPDLVSPLELGKVATAVFPLEGGKLQVEIPVGPGGCDGTAAVVAGKVAITWGRK